jgi:hypothetical protein
MKDFYFYKAIIALFCSGYFIFTHDWERFGCFLIYSIVMFGCYFEISLKDIKNDNK